MKHTYKEILRATVLTEDGTERAIADLLLDDRDWSVRYAVLDTGQWLTGRLVLISPAAFNAPRWADQVIPIRVTARQIEISPPIDADLPVTLAHERALMEHYRWPPPELEAPILPDPLTEHLSPDTRAFEDRTIERKVGKYANPHLFSAGALCKLTAVTSDGQKASLDDILINDHGWRVSGWVVDARPWLPGGTAIVDAKAVGGVNLEAGTVALKLDRAEVEALSTAQAHAGA
jgi:hypothetical protein